MLPDLLTTQSECKMKDDGRPKALPLSGSGTHSYGTIQVGPNPRWSDRIFTILVLLLMWGSGLLTGYLQWH